MTLSENDGLYLIHGPPGSGKTTTIINMLSAYFHCNVPGLQLVSQAGRTLQKRNCVLICTPSNTAVDEIVRRLSRTPILDKDERPRSSVRQSCCQVAPGGERGSREAKGTARGLGQAKMQ